MYQAAAIFDRRIEKHSCHPGNKSQALMRLNVRPAQCWGKIFGDGNMSLVQVRARALNIGQRNGKATRSLLELHGIRIVSESLAIGRRNIVFDVDSGNVWARQGEIE
jgi:chemotaxis receptor (MCP) glutamine deamidase CheD